AFVTDTTAGTRRLYSLRDDGAATISAYMQGVWGDVARRFTLAAENTTPRPGAQPSKQRRGRAR
ncbi:MAG TPA: hypothetical protein VGI86_14840, partial [Acidimicrobiia bacterium]